MCVHVCVMSVNACVFREECVWECLWTYLEINVVACGDVYACVRACICVCVHVCVRVHTCGVKEQGGVKRLCIINEDREARGCCVRETKEQVENWLVVVVVVVIRRMKGAWTSVVVMQPNPIHQKQCGWEGLGIQGDVIG